MMSVFKLVKTLINSGKPTDSILEKMDVYLAAGRLTADEYSELVELLNQRDSAE